MAKALHVHLEAMPGKEAEVEKMLEDIFSSVQREPPTTPWYAFRVGERGFGIFEAFSDEAGREARLNGEAAQILKERGEAILVRPAEFELLDVIGFKIGNAMGSPV